MVLRIAYNVKRNDRSDTESALLARLRTPRKDQQPGGGCDLPDVVLHLVEALGEVGRDAPGLRRRWFWSWGGTTLVVIPPQGGIQCLFSV